MTARKREGGTPCSRCRLPTVGATPEAHTVERATRDGLPGTFPCGLKLQLVEFSMRQRRSRERPHSIVRACASESRHGQKE